MRRLAPRPLAKALAGVVAEVEPATLLARVQSAWDGVVGAGLAASARPLSERDGVITVACESAVWAHELELLGPDLAARLNEALLPDEGTAGARLEGASGAGGAAPVAETEPAPVARLRFVVSSGPNV